MYWVSDTFPNCKFLLYFLDNGSKASYAVRKLAQEDRFALWMTLPVGNIQVFFTNVYANNEFVNVLHVLHEMSPDVILGFPNNLVYGFVNSF